MHCAAVPNAVQLQCPIAPAGLTFSAGSNLAAAAGLAGLDAYMHDCMLPTFHLPLTSLTVCHHALQ